MVYAFSNLHDVSWGTKGDTGVIKKCDDSSGAVKVQKTDDNHFTVTTDFPVNQKDIDYIYELQLREICLQTKKDRDAALPKPMVDLKQKQEDFFKSFRTSVVLSWVFSNTILIVFLTTTEVSNFLNIVVVLPDGSQENYYLVFILWSVAFLSTIKFVGSMLYLAFSS